MSSEREDPERRIVRHLYVALAALGGIGGVGSVMVARTVTPGEVVAEAQGALLEQFAGVLERAEGRIVDQLDARMSDTRKRLDRLEEWSNYGVRGLEASVAELSAAIARLETRLDGLDG